MTSKITIAITIALFTPWALGSSIYKCKGEDGRYTYQESACDNAEQSVPVLNNNAGNSTVSSDQSAMDQLKDMEEIRGTSTAKKTANVRASEQNPLNQSPSWGQRNWMKNNKDDIQEVIQSLPSGGSGSGGPPFP